MIGLTSAWNVSGCFCFLFFSYPFLSVVEGEPQLYIMSRHANPSCLQHHINSVSWLWMFITIKGLDTVKHNFFPNTAQPRLGPAGGSHEHFLFFKIANTWTPLHRHHTPISPLSDSLHYSARLGICRFSSD